LKLLIAKLRRMQFGLSSEKLDRQIEQLKLEELESRKTQLRTGPLPMRAMKRTAPSR